MAHSNRTREYPPLYKRLYSVWYRHMRTYTRHIVSNGFPPFLEPMIFLAGIGLGLGRYVDENVQGLPYIEFLGTGLLVTTAMFTAAYECSFGTFIRLEFDKVYDGMLAAPITTNNLIVGEMLWAGTKGLFFSFAVLCVLSVFGVVPLPASLLAPVMGFVTAFMFSTMSLFIASFVRTINHFNFYFTGFISPMFFFSGVVFPVTNLPDYIQPFSQLVPLTHSVNLVRAICTNSFHLGLLWDILYIVVFSVVFGLLAVKRLRTRLVS
ncbi:Inner membrane transport permease YadH [Anaerohalosphaera lusitana]|uniref:Transport permease protein n=1 Tax=Anaerohalosphaera lusitana TaxID=1936003 RepID=A0A1U9NPJ2_9BACT|nr:Inner membrane transport permease YadH [Anaerohalosphaera lusitana]